MKTVVDSGALQMVLNILERGTPVQQEAVLELRKTMQPLSSNPDIARVDGNSVDLAEIQSDVTAAQERYPEYAFCFTWVTVQSLVDYIKGISK